MEEEEEEEEAAAAPLSPAVASVGLSASSPVAFAPPPPPTSTAPTSTPTPPPTTPPPPAPPRAPSPPPSTRRTGEVTENVLVLCMSVPPMMSPMSIMQPSPTKARLFSTSRATRASPAGILIAGPCGARDFGVGLPRTVMQLERKDEAAVRRVLNARKIRSRLRALVRSPGLLARNDDRASSRGRRPGGDHLARRVEPRVRARVARVPRVRRLPRDEVRRERAPRGG